MFKNFNSQHLLIGIIFIFIVFIFLSRENFYGWLSPPPIMPTPPYFSIPRQFTINPTPANKTCPPNSTLTDNICQYSSSVAKSMRYGWRQCPNNYQASGYRCQVINPTTEPTLKCDEGLVLKEGMCVQQCPGTLTGDLCTFCDNGKLEAGMCLSCNANKELKNGMCY